MLQTAIPCTLMRGGTSKGPFFLAAGLPADPGLRDRVLLAAMGSPDAHQIDGVGGADSLTSKVAIVGPPTRQDPDVDYLFLQVDKAIGVFGTVSVARACALPGSIAAEITGDSAYGARSFEIEHPTGFFMVEMEIAPSADGPQVARSALLRTARALMTGDLYIPGSIWRQPAL